MSAIKLTLSDLELDLTRVGHGRPLLFLHPHVGRESSTNFLTTLSKQFDVIAPSHPGFDLSSVNGGFDSVDDLSYFYLDLLEKLDLEDVVVVGSSFGGWIGLEMVIKSVERIKQLVLIDSVGVKFGSPTENDIADIFSMSDEAFAKKAYVDAKFAPAARDDLTDAELLIKAANQEASARYAWLPCLYDPKLRQRLHRVRISTLVVWGAQDGITAPAYGHQLTASLPQAKYVEIANTGHFPHIENPAAVAQKVIDFVAAGSERANENKLTLNAE